MSCKKDSVSNISSNGTELQSTVSFTVDRITYTINGSLADSSYHGLELSMQLPFQEEMYQSL